MLEVQSGWDLPPWRHNTGKGADESKKSILPHLMSLPLSTNRKIMNFHRHTFSWFFHIFCIFNYGKLLVDDASKCQNAYDWKSDATPGLPALITSSDNEEVVGLVVMGYNQNHSANGWPFSKSHRHWHLAFHWHWHWHSRGKWWMSKSEAPVPRWQFLTLHI